MRSTWRNRFGTPRHSHRSAAWRNFPALYRDHKKDGLCVWFNDLRFALAGRTMPFRYGACRNGTDTVWRIHRLFSDDNGLEILDAFHLIILPSQ